MNSDAVNDSFDNQKMDPLKPERLKTIRDACDEFNSHFNNGLSEEYRYKFTASASNLSDLDYDFYEFGGSHWYRDNGFGFTCAWGTILVERFGFRWEMTEGGQSLRDCVLRHGDAFCVFFPWQYL